MRTETRWGLSFLSSWSGHEDGNRVGAHIFVFMSALIKIKGRYLFG